MSKKLVSTLTCLAIVFVALNLQACDAVQQMIRGTPTPTPTLTHTPTPTLTPTPTYTLTPTITPSPTATPNLVATQQYETFFSKLQKYVDAEYISTTNGKYQNLGDHSLSLAKQGYFQWGMNGVNVKNFIVRSDVTMQTASRTISRSGCGFVFSRMRGASGESQIMLFLGQNGTAYSVMDGYEMHKNYYDIVPNPGEVELTLIVDGDKARLLVNDRAMIKWAPLRDITTDWGYSLISGSNEDFGTKCEFRNIDYWIIEE